MRFKRLRLSVALALASFRRFRCRYRNRCRCRCRFRRAHFREKFARALGGIILRWIGGRGGSDELDVLPDGLLGEAVAGALEDVGESRTNMTRIHIGFRV